MACFQPLPQALWLRPLPLFIISPQHPQAEPSTAKPDCLPVSGTYLFNLQHELCLLPKCGNSRNSHPWERKSVDAGMVQNHVKLYSIHRNYYTFIKQFQRTERKKMRLQYRAKQMKRKSDRSWEQSYKNLSKNKSNNQLERQCSFGRNVFFSFIKADAKFSLRCL